MKNLDSTIIFPRLYAMLPSAAPVDMVMSKEDSPVETPFFGDIVILYGRDVGTHYEIIATRELAEYKITRQELHEIAVSNLSQTKKEIRLHQAEGIHFLRCDGDLESSLILHTGIWDYIQEQVGGDVLASVPARNVLLISGTRKEQVSELKRKACLALEHEHKPISSKLFLRVAGTWKEYDT